MQIPILPGSNQKIPHEFHIDSKQIPTTVFYLLLLLLLLLLLI